MATSKDTKEESLLMIIPRRPLPTITAQLSLQKQVWSRLRTNMIEFWLEIGRSFFVVKHSLFLFFPSVRTLYSSDAPSSLLGTCIQTRLAAYFSLSTVHTKNPTVLRAFTRFEHHSSVFSDLYKLTVIGRNVCLSGADDDPVNFSLLFWLIRLENPLRKFFFSLKLHFSRAANKNGKKTSSRLMVPQSHSFRLTDWHRHTQLEYVHACTPTGSRTPGPVQVGRCISEHTGCSTNCTNILKCFGDSKSDNLSHD